MYFRTVLPLSRRVLEKRKGVCDEETTSGLLRRAAAQRVRPGSQRFGWLVALAPPQQKFRQRRHFYTRTQRQVFEVQTSKGAKAPQGQES